MSTKIERGRGLKRNSTDYNDIYNKLLYKDLNIDVSPESARKSSKYIEKYTKDAWYSCFVSLRNLVETQLFAQELGEWMLKSFMKVPLPFQSEQQLCIGECPYILSFRISLFPQTEQEAFLSFGNFWNESGNY